MRAGTVAASVPVMMMTTNPTESSAVATTEQMREAFEVIERLALSLKQETDLAKIRQGLDEIHAVARYKFNVIPPKESAGEK